MIDASLAGSGVVHVLAQWRPAHWPDDRAGRVIHIGPEAPTSGADAFVLDLARARSDFVLTSGAILRAEPDLRHDRPVRPASADALARWRREVLGMATGPRTVVLSRGLDLDCTHPALHAGSLVLTGPAGAQRLAGPAGRAGLELRELDPAGPREALASLAAEGTEHAGAPRISVELGAQAAEPLYREPVAIDELWLATFLENDLPPIARGAAFLAPRRIREIFGAPMTRVIHREPSGSWSFERYRTSASDR